jgi:hypothetical protein
MWRMAYTGIDFNGGWGSLRCKGSDSVVRSVAAAVDMIELAASWLRCWGDPGTQVHKWVP